MNYIMEAISAAITKRQAGVVITPACLFYLL